MRAAASKKWKQSVYWIILSSLMTGLLFSSGEGIRLLPFPVSTDGGDAKSSRSLDGKNSSVYNPSTHYSGSRLLKINTKFQKNFKHLAGAAFRFIRLDVAAGGDLRLKLVSGFSARSYKSVHLITLSDRAPPAA